MKLKAITATMVTLLLTSLLAMAFGVSLVSTNVGYSSSPLLDRTDIIGVGWDYPDNTDPMLFRMDQDGNMLWGKPLPFERHSVSEYAADRNVAEDSFYMIVGGWNQIDGKNRIQKYDANGDLVWDIPFSPNTLGVSANPVDGGVYVTDIYLGVYKLDENGDILWGPKTFGYSTRSWLVSTDVTSGRAFVSNYYGNVVLKIDRDGNVLWEQYITGSGRLNANPIDGGVYVGAESYARHTYKLDADGNIEWVKYNFPSPYTYPRGVSPVDGAIYISSGWPSRFAKVAMNGTILWNVPNTVAHGYDLANSAIAADIEENYVYTSTGYFNLGINKYSGSDCTLIWHVDPGYYVYTGDPAVDPSPGYRVWIGMPSAVESVSAIVDIDPDTLNLKSKGQWITAYIELPEGYNVSDIDVSTVMLNDIIPVSLLDVPAPEPVPTEIGDYDDDGVSDLMVKFNATAVTSYIISKIGYPDTSATVTLTIAGKLIDGTPFEGGDTIWAITPVDFTKLYPRQEPPYYGHGPTGGLPWTIPVDIDT